MPKQEIKTNRRSPIVVVMGHVDHGKTSLLDYIRKTTVAAREAGGITQAVGAYEIEHGGRRMTFIDTPGHEAFTKMRSRGAEAADLAILIVAADEGVKPQTKEAIKILTESKTPFVVAMTKTDKPSADVNKVKNELTAAGVLLEGYGGSISFHGVSSKTGEGVNDLLDLLLLAADMENLEFDPLAPASGFILEAKRDPRRGIEASVIVKNGTLKRGSEMHTATAEGKIKILEDFTGKGVESLMPSAPALIIGLEVLPQVGELFSANPVERTEKTTAPKTQAAKANKETLNLVLKAVDAGSLEVLSSIIGAMGTDEKPLKIVDESVGDITDGDVKTAIATNAVIIGFKNKTDKGARNLAEPREIKIIISDIVYDLVKTVQEFLAELGLPKTMGELEVLAVFNVKKLSEQLVGGRVASGIIRNKAPFDVMRGASENPAGSGRIMNLREKKTEITQAETGREIGLLVNAGIEIQVGDKLIVRK